MLRRTKKPAQRCLHQRSLRTRMRNRGHLGCLPSTSAALSAFTSGRIGQVWPLLRIVDARFDTFCLHLIAQDLSFVHAVTNGLSWAEGRPPKFWHIDNQVSQPVPSHHAYWNFPRTEANDCV